MKTERSRPRPNPAASAPVPVKLMLVIAYDGSGYDGWQSQRTGVGVQSLVEAALAKLFPSSPRVFGSSRTDAGCMRWGWRRTSKCRIRSGG